MVFKTLPLAAMNKFLMEFCIPVIKMVKQFVLKSSILAAMVGQLLNIVITASFTHLWSAYYGTPHC